MLGGAQTSIRLLAEELALRGDHVSVLTYGPGESVSTSTLDGVHVTRLPLRNLYWPFAPIQPSMPLKLAWHTLDVFNPMMYRAAYVAIDTIRPDVVHTNVIAGFSTSVWSAAAKHKLPIVHTLRDYYLLCLRSSMFKNGSTCATRCVECAALSAPKRKSSALVGAVLGISNHILQQHLVNGFFKGVQVRRVIPNPVRTSLAGRERSDSGKLRVGYFGMLSDHKGVATFLAAAEALSGSGARFVVGGKGTEAWERRVISAHERGQLTYLGHVPPDQFYREIDVLVVPSRWQEPFGRVVIEAYSYGVPVLSSKVGGLTELVKDGRTGYLFDAEKPCELVELISKCMSHDGNVSMMAESCLKEAELFSPSSVASSYSAIYNQLVDAQSYALLPAESDL